MKFKAQGKDTIIHSQAKIVFAEKIVLGHSVIIDDFVLFVGAENSRVESFSHIGAHSSIIGGGIFEMQGFTGISQGCRIVTGTDEGRGDWLMGPAVPPQFRKVDRSHVILEKHVHLGTGCIVLPGVTLAEGTYVGANSLVTKDTEPWSIYVGSPARKIKPRPKDRILALEKECLTKCFDSEGNYLSWR